MFHFDCSYEQYESYLKSYKKTKILLNQTMLYEIRKIFHEYLLTDCSLSITGIRLSIELFISIEHDGILRFKNYFILYCTY